VLLQDGPHYPVLRRLAPGRVVTVSLRDDADYRCLQPGGEGAEARVREARAQRGIAKAALFPTVNASAATAAVTSPAIQLRSELSARIRPLAPISPIESGTSAAWMIAGQREWLDRFSR